MAEIAGVVLEPMSGALHLRHRGTAFGDQLDPAGSKRGCLAPRRAELAGPSLAGLPLLASKEGATPRNVASSRACIRTAQNLTRPSLVGACMQSPAG